MIISPSNGKSLEQISPQSSTTIPKMKSEECDSSSTPHKSSRDSSITEQIMSAISFIKTNKQQCHIKQILTRMKENALNVYESNKCSETLQMMTQINGFTERDLMYRLENAVKDGVLSRCVKQGFTNHNTKSPSSPSKSKSIIYKLPIIPNNSNQTSASNNNNNNKQVHNFREQTHSILPLIIK
jgi:hypothetical protein